MADPRLLLCGTQTITEQGHLTIGGCDTVALATEFGTPLYVIDEQHVRENARQYRSCFESGLPGVEIAFAAKALMNTTICRIMEQEGERKGKLRIGPNNQQPMQANDGMPGGEGGITWESRMT